VVAFAQPSSSNSGKNVEEQLLSAIAENGRLDNTKRINGFIKQLEQQKSIPEPAIAPEVMGRWKLVYSTNADTASPIQRTAFGANQFNNIYQNIFVDEKNTLIVSQVVQFSNQFEIILNALASTSQYPLKELTERKSSGRIFGFNLLGVSLVGDEAIEKTPNARINFVFDEGNLDLFDGLVKVPYPVPFRLPLFRDVVKAWLDITYLSETIRISRGNKGTTFVLVKDNKS